MVDVLFEDNHLLVLNKPAGLLTQPSGREEESLEGVAKAWLKKKYEKPGNVFLGAVHRLDRAASGIVVFAKTSKALSRLSASIRENQVVKLYHALVESVPSLPEAVLEDYLKHDSFRAEVVEKGTKDAKLARLKYRLLRAGSNGALLEVELETGRYHQIRAQLAARGMPILGDTKYGCQKKWDLPGIALHHFHFSIPHPVTKEPLSFEVREKWTIQI